MLVLSRKPGEQIVIGDSIVVTVVQVRGGQVRIGFEAPDSVSILREEIVPPEHPLRRNCGPQGPRSG